MLEYYGLYQGRKTMPIKLIMKNQKPYAYKWGGHGATYLVSKYGTKGAYNKAVKQAQAAHSAGYSNGGTL